MRKKSNLAAKYHIPPEIEEKILKARKQAVQYAKANPAKVIGFTLLACLAMAQFLRPRK